MERFGFVDTSADNLLRPLCLCCCHEPPSVIGRYNCHPGEALTHNFDPVACSSCLAASENNQERL
jgi:hypothetical protein